eukprot:gene29-40_t
MRLPLRCQRPPAGSCCAVRCSKPGACLRAACTSAACTLFPASSMPTPAAGPEASAGASDLVYAGTTGTRTVT